LKGTQKSSPDPGLFVFSGKEKLLQGGKKALIFWHLSQADTSSHLPMP
jgi:hypothetical protein